MRPAAIVDAGDVPTVAEAKPAFIARNVLGSIVGQETGS